MRVRVVFDVEVTDPLYPPTADTYTAIGHQLGQALVRLDKDNKYNVEWVSRLYCETDSAIKILSVPEMDLFAEKLVSWLHNRGSKAGLALPVPVPEVTRAHGS
jgi:hypothetical protein